MERIRSQSVEKTSNGALSEAAHPCTCALWRHW